MTDDNAKNSDVSTEASERELTAYNYCVAFVDLLGQRDAMHGQGLLKTPESEEQQQAFEKMMRNSIGAIIKLQKRASHMLKPLIEANLSSPLRARLPTEQRVLWDEMQQTHIQTQRWSDGLVHFVCLGDQDIKCHMNGVFGMFGLAGVLCLLGLAGRTPIRGAIEIAWGVEIYPGELYGPAVARSYELESNVAQYPRIVVGPETVNFLRVHASYCGEDVFKNTNRELAAICLNMLAEDSDGQWMLNFLGHEFRESVTSHAHAELYNAARGFVFEQLNMHRLNKNTKLAFRYAQLANYFDAHAL